MSIWSAEIKELEKLNESLKGRLPDLEKELARLIKADDENMILLYSRKCLEVIITDLCESELKRPRKTEPLKGIIDKFIDKLIEKSDISLAGSPEFYTGWYYSAIGEIDSAFYWLEKAYGNRCPEIP